MKRIGTVGFITVAALACGPLAGELKLYDMGTLGGSIAMCDPDGISADGQTVVGRSLGPAGRQAIRWTIAGGLQALPHGDGVTESRAYDVSADGRHIVGMRKLTDQMTHTTTWVDGVLQEPFEAVSYSSGYAISDNANVIALTDMRPDPDDGNMIKGMTVLWYNPFEISASYVEVLPLWDPDAGLPPHSLTGSVPLAISGDGLVVTGYSLTSQARNAVRWARDGTDPWSVHSFWDYPDTESTYAYGTSADGSVVVGAFTKVITVDNEPKSVWRGFRWTQGANPDMEELAPLPGDHFSQANDVSGDGSIVVGISSPDNANFKAVYWDETGAVHDFNTREGMPLPDGWTLTWADVVSGRGNEVSGVGTSGSGNIGWYLCGLRDGNPFEAATDLPDNWAVSETFGYFWRAGKSHVWHAEHGWQYVPKGNADSIIIYDYGLKEWIWENEQTYPYMYLYGNEPSWMWYAKGCEPGERFFFHYEEGKWKTESELGAL